MIWGGADVIIIEIKCTKKCNAFELPWNYPSCPSPWKNFLLWNRSLGPKRLGTADTGCFYVLAVVNGAAINTGRTYIIYPHYPVFFFLPFSIYPKVGHLSHRLVLFFNVWGISILFSIVAAPIYIPTNSAQEFPFLHILTSTCNRLPFW